jgi:hypothetical protein
LLLLGLPGLVGGERGQYFVSSWVGEAQRQV